MELGFKEWLILNRRAKGLSQEQVGEALGVSKQTIGTWERGKANPELQIWQTKELCSLFNCKLEDIPGQRPD